jgi:Lipocalin-like domain
MKLWTILTLTAATMALTTVSARTDDIARSVVGTWRLVAAKSKAVDGSVEDLYGSAPLGQLIYDSAGHMSVHLLKPNLSKCGTLDRRTCPNPQAREAFDNYLGYWGHYILAENTVLHEIEGASVPDWVGTSQKRLIQISGKHLTITTPPQQVGGVQSTVVLEWEREQSKP